MDSRIFALGLRKIFNNNSTPHHEVSVYLVLSIRLIPHYTVMLTLSINQQSLDTLMTIL